MNISINSYNVCRTSLAVGLLLTLLFNSNYILFGKNPPDIDSFHFYKANLFFIMPPMIAKIIAVIGLISVISGFYPRLTGILQWYITYSFLTYCDIFDGGDQLSSNLTFFLIPLTIFDNSKNHWKDGGIKYQNNYFIQILQKIFFNLILVQVCIVYLHAFVGKLAIEEWTNGTAVYYWLTNTYFGINPAFTETARYILSNEFVTTFITWGTLFLEFTLSAFIFVSRNDKRRYFLFFVAVFFHFSIFLFHGLASFFFAAFAALTIYLIPENKIFNINL